MPHILPPHATDRAGLDPSRHPPEAAATEPKGIAEHGANRNDSKAPIRGNDSPLLTIGEFSEFFGNKIGRNSLYAAVNSGRIFHVRVGRKILILASELEEWPLREVARAA